MLRPSPSILNGLFKFPIDRIISRTTSISSEKCFLDGALRASPTDDKDVFIQRLEEFTIVPNRTPLFGGTMIATAINAARQTLSPPRAVHSVHSYYVNAADVTSPIYYHVTRLRDGKSFATRSVTARQNAQVVFHCSISFHQYEQGNLQHQPTLEPSNIPPPEELQSTDTFLKNILQNPRLTPEKRRIVEEELKIPLGLDVRYCHYRDPIDVKSQWPARFLLWIKTIGRLSDDPQSHQALIAFASDRFLMVSPFYPYELFGFDARVKLQTSLDHVIWFHDGFDWDALSNHEKQKTKVDIPRSSKIPTRSKACPVRADDWLLFDIECPTHMNHRALAIGRVWTRDKRLVATCAQEGLIRTH